MLNGNTFRFFFSLCNLNIIIVKTFWNFTAFTGSLTKNALRVTIIIIIIIIITIIIISSSSIVVIIIIIIITLTKTGKNQNATTLNTTGYLS